MWKSAVFLLTVASIAAAAEVKSRRVRDSSTSIFNPFPFLQIVRFANDECAAESASSGTCYTAKECDDLKGHIQGDCANGYGSCCVLTYSCRETMRHNLSYFVPPSYPEKEEEANVCPLKIAFEATICQIRLDFERFDILGPKGGDCVDDLFVVLGGNVNHRVPVICGQNANQHIYVNVDTVEGPLELQMITGIARYSRDWRIKVSMVPCDSPFKAPNGCLQFFTGGVGNFRSFNFNQPDTNRSGYLNSVDYAICLRRERDMCYVTYSVGRGTGNSENSPGKKDNAAASTPTTTPRGPRDNSLIRSNSFGIATSTDKSMDFQSDSKGGSSKCTGDYLAIFGLERFCGGAFSLTSGSKENQPITVKDSGPLMVLFKSDKTFNGRGFDIDFVQGPCMPITFF
ncbi:uncharacterized protein LOC108863710 [Galendromus occidentalis]|uniref:Uncharacterized protein LOC108863710 n=1 Tax=Galendromus occidentalis TaxID=34638 RepID=A0AAJ7P909_9ACAR|nr:uncharacterized protein LOC108863710 [Galendromus occidentalis]